MLAEDDHRHDRPNIADTASELDRWVEQVRTARDHGRLAISRGWDEAQPATT